MYNNSIYNIHVYILIYNILSDIMVDIINTVNSIINTLVIKLTKKSDSSINPMTLRFIRGELDSKDIVS